MRHGHHGRLKEVWVTADQLHVAKSLAQPARGVERQIEATGNPVALRAPTLLMHVEAIRAGTGRGVIPCYIGDGHRLLERLTAPIPELAATYWMIVHRDLRRSACVRAVIDWMRALFAEQ
jgi:DNA-binding transcriptional LysR family regulator